MERPRDWPLEQVVALREDMGELRANVVHLGADLAQLRQDVRAELADVWTSGGSTGASSSSCSARSRRSRRC
ncbi:MAG TPA: hypothetical protein VK874_15900 [Gaiellaceae bacterium]|nr:hypothetical protein [Gaiellaceae bacterium]